MKIVAPVLCYEIQMCCRVSGENLNSGVG